MRDLLAHLKAARDMVRHGIGLDSDELLLLIDEAEAVGARDVAETLERVLDRINSVSMERALERAIELAKKHNYIAR